MFIILHASVTQCSSTHLEQKERDKTKKQKNTWDSEQSSYSNTKLNITKGRRLQHCEPQRSCVSAHKYSPTLLSIPKFVCVSSQALTYAAVYHKVLAYLLTNTYAAVYHKVPAALLTSNHLPCSIQQSSWLCPHKHSPTLPSTTKFL